MILEPESTDYARYALSVIPSPVVQRFSTDLNPEVCHNYLQLTWNTPGQVITTLSG